MNSFSSLKFPLICGLLGLGLSFSSGCAHWSAKKNKTGELASKASAAGTNSSTLEEPGEPTDPDEEYNSDSPSLEAKDETPSELGDVDAKQDLQADEIEADRLSRQTFPLVYNEFVDQWVRFFTGRGRGTFERWLQRSTRYIPMIKQVLQEEGLPPDLIYLAMIESGFNPKARSHAKAVGPWQFIKSTGERYGLQVDYWIDERKDITKSTRAAAHYLKELHQIFGSWYLAAAAYNAGEGKVLMAIRRDRSRNFWELSRKKKNFRKETQNYVPKIIAAALLAKNPERYGFVGLEYEQPLSWTEVSVPAGVDLKSVAEVTDVPLDTLRILNAELRRDITPPGDGFKMRVPQETGSVLAAKVSELKTKKVGRILTHTIRRGDTLGAIARRYGVDVQAIMEFNSIRSAKKLRLGMELEIPVAEGLSRVRFKERTSDPRNKTPQAKSRKRSESSASLASAESAGSYKVQEGDTLWDIAKRFNTSVDTLLKTNGLKSSRNLRVGMVLKLPTTPQSQRSTRNSKDKNRSPASTR